MKKFFRIAALSTACFFASAPLLTASAETPVATDAPEYVVAGSKVHTLQSQIVDQLYELRVSLPAGFDPSSDQSYPVVYVLDGQWNYTLVSDMMGKHVFDGMVPEAVVVAITWGGEGDDPNILRFRDFTYAVNPLAPMSGGAESFLMAIKQEIIPYAENLYKGSGERALLGGSLGGLFSTFAMLEEPGLFDAHIALSAPYMFENSYIEQRLAELEGSADLKGTRLYLGVGELDLNKTQVLDFKEQLKQSKLKGLRLKTKVIKGVGHAGGEITGFSQGLLHAFKRPQLKLSESYLSQFNGTYTFVPQAPALEIVAEQGKLLLLQEGQPTIELLAQSETEFYVKGMDLNVLAQVNEEGQQSLVLDFQGNEFTYTRQ